MIPSVDSTHSLFSLNKVTGGLNKLPFKIEGMYMNSPFIVDNHEILTLIKSTIIGIDVDNGYVCENECELLENNKRNIARFMKKEYITIAYMDHIVKTNTTFTILNTINGNSIDFLTLRHNLHNKNVEMILPNSEKQEMWKVKIDKEIGFAFYYSRRNNELYQIPVHIKVIQHQLNLGSFEYRGNQMMYASISDFFNQCFEDEKPFLLTQNPKSQNIESIDVITNKINQVSDQKITTSLEFPPITKEQFMQYPNIQSYVSHMNKKINDSSISNETLFVLIVIVLISFLGFVFVVMILYVNYIKKLLKNNKKVHQLFEVTKTILGHGCLGTIVFEGKYQNKRIAVKRLVKEFHQVAQNEMSVISMTDEKPHLVRCYGSFTDENFIYIGLTYCPYTLDEYLKKYFTYSPNTPLLNEETVRLMRECATGIYYLHQLGIVHRDIKPQNVLVDHENRIRITDFGLSKSLDPHSSSFSNSTNKGSNGWQAPEMLTDKPRLSKAVDIFTLGCLFYYISTTNHPYGDSVERQRNIIRGVCVATPCSNNNIYQSEFIACFNGMIRNDPSQRHDIKEVLAHPLFWSLKKRLEFIQKTSDIIIAEKNPYVIKELGKAGIVVSWDKDLDPIIMDSLNTCRFRVYNFNRTEDLLRVIRNQSHHYYTLADEEKNLYKTFPEGFYQYYHSKFPSLCVVVHNVMKKNYMHHPTFFDFFEPQL